MGKLKRKYIATAIVIGLTCAIFCSSANATSETSTEKNIIALDAASLKMADIHVTLLQPRILAYLIPTPGEVIPNANLTTKVSTRVPAQACKGRSTARRFI